MSGATLSRERFLLECARQERLEREAEASRVAFAEAIAAARREGAEAERAEWMSCALVDAMMEGPALKGWNRSALDRLWRRGLAPEPPE